MVTDQKDGPSDGNGISYSQDFQVARLPVDPCTIGAVQVSENQSFIVFLDFHVKAADPLVIELNYIPLFPADGNGH